MRRKAQRILSFLSDVTIKTNGDLDVTETIQILALNQQINDGSSAISPPLMNGAGLRTNVVLYGGFGSTRRP